jgi:hypothetical protein
MNTADRRARRFLQRDADLGATRERAADARPIAHGRREAQRNPLLRRALE